MPVQLKKWTSVRIVLENLTQRWANILKINHARGAWVAQSVKPPSSAQDMILRLVSSSPPSGSVLTAHNLEPASDSVSPSLSAPRLPLSERMPPRKETSAGVKVAENQATYTPGCSVRQCLLPAR